MLLVPAWLLGLPAPVAAQDDLLATAFGKVPYLWGVRLSPDGSRISFLHMVEAGVPVAYVMDATGEPEPVLSSTPGKFDIYWCRWANNERLLCGFHGIDGFRGKLISATRLVAVNADGSDPKVLLQDQLKDEMTQYQDDVVDWLPDDPEHVLIEVPSLSGTGVSRLNIYTGNTRIIERHREGTREWMSDGRGTVRLRRYSDLESVKWYFRRADSDKWEILHQYGVADQDADYYPVGFGEDPDDLLVYKALDGRLALMSEDLRKRRPDEVVFAHDNVDTGNSLTIGKYNRLVAVGYHTDMPHLHFFDTEIERLSERIAVVMPDKLVSVIDESWDKRYYLVLVGSDQDPGTYYRLDTQAANLQEIFPRRPEFSNYRLAVKQPVSYPARDDVQIPGYLTLPTDMEASKLPAVILPHGGPESRDIWDFDWLSQYFAARGYAVLQSNFRGSGGYGDEWAGEGGYRQWREAVDDINDGVGWLIEQGIADPGRVCIVGWSYGGYAALLSSLEAPELYQCTVSIAGVTDLDTLKKDSRGFLHKKWRYEQVGSNKETLEQGSPLKRAREFQQPVLLFHGDRDINVTVRHSKKMHKALKKADKSTELVLYEDTAHSIWRDEYRIDLLARTGAFLDANTGAD